MKLYLEMNDFTSSSVVMATLRSYNAINGNVEIYVKADGSEFNELDDFKKIRRRNKFDEDDLKSINFFIKTYNDFESFCNNNEKNIVFRIHDDTMINEKRIYLFFNKDIKEEDLKIKIDNVINFYNKYILKENENKNISLGMVEKYNYKKDPIYNFVKTNINEFKEYIPLKNCIDNKCDIVLIDNELSYYIFTLLSYYSKFKKREKSVKSYFATFKPFSYHKVIENDVNLESLFTYSTFEINIKDNRINLYVSKDISPSEFFSLITFLQKLNSNFIDE